MFGELKPHEIEKLIGSQIVGRLACFDDGVGYIVPISYDFDGKYLYARSKEGMKVQMMRKNPKVCFQTDQMLDMANWQSAVVWGEYEELTTEKERNRALKQLIDRVLPVISSETMHFSPQWPFPPDEIGSIKGVVFRIRIEKMTGRFEKSSPDTFYAS